MHAVITMSFMVVLGAFIGGLTNSIAIKMLFRPYQAIYLKKWRLPFTPGLIPKRREELANQLGNMVVNHLLTPESIRNKMISDEFLQEITMVAQSQAEKWFESKQSVADWLEQNGMANSLSYIKMEQKLDEFVEKQYETYMESRRSIPVKTMLDETWQQKIETAITSATVRLLKQASIFFLSEAGKNSIEAVVDDFLNKRSGKLSGMLQMLFGNLNIAEKIQPEIGKILKSEHTKDFVITAVKNEWYTLLEKDVNAVEAYVGRDKMVGLLQTVTKKMVHVDQLLHMPVAEMAYPYKNKILQSFIPTIVRRMATLLGNKMEKLVDRLQVATIVRNQVASFPIERLEEMILSISRRELKMITYLGALLGGFIGFIQGIIALFFR